MEAINLPLYQRIARQLKSAIERGELTPGSRLPASRVYAQEQGVSREKLAWVHSPIGLPIGGRTPGMIAVSIVAELIQVYTAQCAE